MDSERSPWPTPGSGGQDSGDHEQYGYGPEQQSFTGTFLKNYANFSGRASRAEYWLLSLGLAVVEFLVLGVATLLENQVAVLLAGLFSVFLILPLLSVAVRRLHDTGKSGWWWCIQLVPLVGGIVFFVFMILPSQSGPNEYGPNPYGE